MSLGARVGLSFFVRKFLFIGLGVGFEFKSGYCLSFLDLGICNFSFF